MRVLVAVCGSIAAYRSVDFVRELQKRGHEIKVLLTRGAEEFVSARVFETFLGERPLSNLVFDPSHAGTDHISVARWAERVVIYGATAHFLSSYRQGLADDFLQTQLLAFRGEVCVMPAMNPSMWTHPATSENFEILGKRGVRFWGPVGGRVACGEEGVGHLIAHSEALQLFDALSGTSQPVTGASLGVKGPRVLVSMGPMRSRLDSVRYLQNESSGRMGLELVRSLQKHGISPQVLLGPVESTVASEVEREVGRDRVDAYFDDRDYGGLLEAKSRVCDIFFSASAVLDFAFAGEAGRKLDKGQVLEGLRVRPVEDFAATFGRDKEHDQWLVSFSAEVDRSDRALLERAVAKKLSKNAEWTLVNRVAEGSGPHAASSQAWILDPEQSITSLGPSLGKDLIAERLVSAVLSGWQSRPVS